MNNKALVFVIGIISVVLLISILNWGMNIATHIESAGYGGTGIETEISNQSI